MNFIEIYQYGFDFDPSRRIDIFARTIYRGTPIDDDVHGDDLDDALTLRMISRLFVLCKNKSRSDGLAAPNYYSDNSDQLKTAAIYVTGLLHPGSDYRYARGEAMKAAVTILDQMAEKYASRDGFAGFAQSVAAFGEDFKKLQAENARKPASKRALAAG